MFLGICSVGGSYVDADFLRRASLWEVKVKPLLAGVFWGSRFERILPSLMFWLQIPLGDGHFGAGSMTRSMCSCRAGIGPPLYISLLASVAALKLSLRRCRHGFGSALLTEQLNPWFLEVA
jgi:hypothetical protein